MYSPQYLLKSFESPAIAPVARRRIFGRLIDVLVRANDADLEGQKRPPVANMRVLPGELWQDTARVAQLGGGTCPSLVAYRIAELHKAGERGATWVFDTSGKLWVKRMNGTREDPCKGAPWNTSGYSSAMWTPTLEFASFETTPADKKMEVICKMLAVLHETNGQWLAAGGKAPPVYSSGVKYKEEELGKDEWQDIPRTLDQWSRGIGSDCEDLASWRVSELRAKGEDAWHTVEHRKSPTLVLYHIRVLRQNGDQEDPSCALGMSGSCANLVKASGVRQQTAGAQRPEDWGPFEEEHTGAGGQVDLISSLFAHVGVAQQMVGAVVVVRPADVFAGLLAA